MGTTANYSLPYPEPTGAVQPDVDIKALAQALDTQLVTVNALLVPAVVTTTASVGTVTSPWTVNDVRAVSLLGGKLVTVDLYLVPGALYAENPAGSGNIGDQTCFTLLTAYQPTHPVECPWDNGAVGGNAVINTDGTVVIRTITGFNAASGGGLASGTNVRISATFIKG